MCQLYVLTSKNQSSDSSEPRTQYSKWITSSWPNCLDIIWYRVCTVQHWINDRHAYSMQTRRIRRLHFHCTRGNATGICALYRNVLRFQRLKQPSTLWTARALKHLVFLPPRKHNDTTLDNHDNPCLILFVYPLKNVNRTPGQAGPHHLVKMADLIKTMPLLCKLNIRSIPF